MFNGWFVNWKTISNRQMMSTNRKKIAIITFHDANNYGAILQAIGLKHYLEQNACVVDFLSLQITESIKSRIKIKLRVVKRFFKIKSIESKYILNLKNNYNFVLKQYAQQHLPTIRINSISELSLLSKNYNCIIVGSDQIWNTNMNLLSGEFFRFFFLDVNLYCKHISYAASFGVSNQSNEKLILFSPLLKKFDTISVRDNFSNNIVKSTGCISPTVVCDPTLLHDYSDIIQKPLKFDKIPENYIFTYCLNKENEPDYLAILSKLRNELEVPILSITSYGHTNWELPGCDCYIRTANPGEWIYLLSKSQFVFTDSFHGTIFALKYRRPFLSYSHQTTRGDRTKDLAKRYKFENRLVSRSSSLSELIKIGIRDLDTAYSLMNEHQKVSMEWLLKHGVNTI
jgi:hypothetical protein